MKTHTEHFTSLVGLLERVNGRERSGWAVRQIVVVGAATPIGWIVVFVETNE